MNVCMYACMHVIYRHEHMQTLCVCMYVCMYVCMHVISQHEHMQTLCVCSLCQCTRKIKYVQTKFHSYKFKYLQTKFKYVQKQQIQIRTNTISLINLYTNIHMLYSAQTPIQANVYAYICGQICTHI
jgi:hypothetical protein